MARDNTIQTGVRPIQQKTIRPKATREEMGVDGKMGMAIFTHFTLRHRKVRSQAVTTALKAGVFFEVEPVQEQTSWTDHRPVQRWAVGFPGVEPTVLPLPRRSPTESPPGRVSLEEVLEFLAVNRVDVALEFVKLRLLVHHCLEPNIPEF